MQEYQTLALILSAAFGGKKGQPGKDGEAPDRPDAGSMAHEPENFAQLQAAFKAVMTGGGSG